MHRGLIKALAYMYQFITLGRGKLSSAELQDGAAWADTMVRHAPEVLDAEQGDDPKNIQLDLAQAEIVEGHIEEMVAWLQHLEIV